MSAAARPVQGAAIQQYAKQLRLPTLGGQFARLAGEAVKEQQSHLSYLEALLEGEVEEREQKANRAGDSGSTPTAGEDAGGVRLPVAAAHCGGAGEESERRWIPGAQGAGHTSGGDRSCYILHLLAT